MTTIHIEVTQDDIENGLCWHSVECPIARALRRDPWFNTKGEVRVGGDELAYRDGNLRRVRKLPTQAIQFIQDFDAGRAVVPFSFDLEVAR